MLRSSPLEVTAAIKKLTEIITFHGIQCVVSEVTYRDDDLGKKAKEVNKIMKNDLPSNVKIIDNTNISQTFELEWFTPEPKKLRSIST